MPRKKRGRAATVPDRSKEYEYQRENVRLGDNVRTIPPLPPNMEEAEMFRCPVCGMWSHINYTSQSRAPSLEEAPYLPLLLALHRWGGGYGRMDWYDLDDPQLQEQVANAILRILPTIAQALGAEVSEVEPVREVQIPVPVQPKQRRVVKVSKPKETKPVPKEAPKPPTPTPTRPEAIIPEVLPPEEETRRISGPQVESPTIEAEARESRPTPEIPGSTSHQAPLPKSLQRLLEGNTGEGEKK